MVDSISQSGGAPGVKRATSDTAARLQQSKGATTTAQPATAGETTQISTSAQGIPAELKAGPPIELELVTRIQEAIAEGNYPIDLDAITESLFESYLELNN
jgi:negative regulator of flagellin synthesis FlgM